HRERDHLDGVGAGLLLQEVTQLDQRPRWAGGAVGVDTGPREAAQAGGRRSEEPPADLRPAAAVARWTPLLRRPPLQRLAVKTPDSLRLKGPPGRGADAGFPLFIGWHRVTESQQHDRLHSDAVG